jgi:aspartate 1-decarboxylase
VVQPGDLVIIITYGSFDEAGRREHRPRVVHVDGANRIVALGDDPAEPVPGAQAQLAGR